MNRFAAVEKLKALVINCELPETDVALYGVRCPYCGKSDRIEQLEPPEKLALKMAPQESMAYANLWQQLVGSDGAAGICKFCQNILKLIDDRHAEPF